ncbi:MAG: hypothetical protein BWY24_00076 [Microgenomates group bacterium ADurb.Bin219]|nr:MAG: hypothetical protein BWY24_00076 [Microgenomates group bacterium ADurb.Bin219]
MTALPVQILLFLTVFILTTVLTLCGIQVFHILKELRESVKKANKILDDFGIISESVAKPVSGISGFLTGLKSGTEIINLLKGRKKE